MNKNCLQFKNWYSEAYNKLKDKFPHDYKLIAGLIASTSPRIQLKRNLETAMLIYKGFKKNENKFINNAINNPRKFKNKYGIMQCHYLNIIKVLTHDFKEPLNLGGYKVNSFYNNLIGNYNYVTIDSWMLKVLKWDKKRFPTNNQYKKLSQLIIDKAKKINVFPCELQAILWQLIRIKEGFKPIYLKDYL